MAGLLMTWLMRACRAPSLINAQPWRLECLSPTRVGLSLREMPELDPIDPQGRQRVLSLGAFIGTAQVAAHSLGHTLRVRTDGPFVSTLSLGAKRKPAPEWERPLYQRATHRGPYDGAELSASQKEPLSSRAQPLWRGAALSQSAVALEQATLRLADSNPDQAGASPQALAAARRQAVETASGLLLFFTAGDTRDDWLWAGMQLALTWLEVERLGLVAQPLTAGVEDATCRQLLEAHGRSQRLQALLRVGQTSARQAPAPRRELELLGSQALARSPRPGRVGVRRAGR